MDFQRDKFGRVLGLPQLPASMEAWEKYFAGMDIPVLRRTIRHFDELLEHRDSVDVRSIAEAVLDDPLMTLKVYAWSAKGRSRRQVTDLETLEPIILMSGIDPFFRHFKNLRSIEARLEAYPLALAGLLRVVSRSYRAAAYARDWALRRRDLDTEVILIAALLHDFIEMLMWVLAPEDCLAMEGRKSADAALRSDSVQIDVFGVPFPALEHALASHWRLPELLVSMMDDHKLDHPSVRNVIYAVRLARHTAKGWDNAALPDDFKDIGDLLNIPVPQVQDLLVPGEWRAHFGLERHFGDPVQP